MLYRQIAEKEKAPVAGNAVQLRNKKATLDDSEVAFLLPQPKLHTPKMSNITLN